MNPVGYLINTKGGQQGEPGVYYDYILAGNGLFVRARNLYLTATVQVSYAEVRGLAPMKEAVELLWGRIPRSFYELSVNTLAVDPREERFLAITCDDRYHIKVPAQEGTSGGVTYDRVPNTVLDIHSHGSMGAFFSSTDNFDEQRLGLYMVVGDLHTLLPEVKIRMGVYGYFAPLKVGEVFD